MIVVMQGRLMSLSRHWRKYKDLMPLLLSGMMMMMSSL